MGHGDEHDVHNQDAGHEQADRRDTANGIGQRGKDAVEGGQNRVLGDDGDVFFALVSFFQGFENELLDGLDSFAGPGFHQDTEQRRCIKQLLCRRDRDDDGFLYIDPDRASLGTEDADDPKTPVANAHPLPERRLRSEQLVADFFTDNTDRAGDIDIRVGQKAAFGHFPVAQRQQFMGGAKHRHFTAAAFPAGIGGTDIEWSDAAHQVAARQRSGIVEGQVTGGFTHQGAG